MRRDDHTASLLPRRTSHPLRWYQRAAVDKTYAYLSAGKDNPLVVMPTASGKTHVIKQFCVDAIGWGSRPLVLAPSRELLDQAEDKLLGVLDDSQVGIYCAGLNRKELGRPITLASIQSIYKNADRLGPVNPILVDEAHLVPPASEGMYRTFLDDMRVVNPESQVFGLTATPYRMGTGSLADDDGIFGGIAFEVGIRPLIEQGYLCPLRSKIADRTPDLSGVHVRGGEYIHKEMEAAVNTHDNVHAAAADIVRRTEDRHSVLVFAAGVDHARAVADAIASHTDSSVDVVLGETLHRGRILDDFKERRLRYLVNCEVLTTGFDATCIDAIALLRPTKSPGLYYQMVGRGLRLDPSKTDCLVLDYARNIIEHGPIDDLREPRAKGKGGGESEPTVRACPQCRTACRISDRVCPECGHEFPPPEPKHDTQAHDGGVLSSEVEPERDEVMSVGYFPHVKRDAPEGHPRTMRVEYQIAMALFVKEWVCVEHSGFAGEKAKRWWRERSLDDMPADADEACEMANAGALAEPVAVWHKPNARGYPEIVRVELGPLPERIEAVPELDIPLDQIPF